jgi:putative ABC transport system permease protein
VRGLLSGSVLHDLRTQKLRLTLTLFGIVWGTFAVVVLLAFGTGLERKAEEEMGGGQGVVSLRSGRTAMAYRGLPPERTIRLRPEDAVLLRSEVPEIGLVSEVSSMSRTVRFGRTVAQATLYGVEPEYESLHTLGLERNGRFINRRDLMERRRVAVLGPTLSQEFFGRTDPLGRQIEVSGSSFTVIGVLTRREGAPEFATDNRIIVPATTYRTIHRTSTIAMIQYAPASAELAPRALQHAFDLLGSRYRFDPADRRALAQFDMAEMEQEIRYFLLGFKVFLAVVGGFTLLVGGIGVANIMFVVVRERRVEIGVKRAMGARRSDIMVQFLVEAALLVGLGAFLGFLLAVISVELAGLIPATEDLGDPVISLGVAAGTTALIAVVALAAGVFPARHATRLDPVTCLRG